MKRKGTMIGLAFALAPALVVGVLGGSSLSHAADGPAPFAREAREAHIRSALVALGDTPRAALAAGMDHARTLARGVCSAGAQRLRVECLMVAMKRYCQERADAVQTRNCPVYMDIAASTVLADEALIPPGERYRIVRENADHRAALARELARIQGTLAVDFRLHSSGGEGPDALAADIDRYCREGAADSPLPYPICVTSLIWFIRGAT